MKKLLFVVALAACGGKSSGTTTTPPPTTAPATTPIELGEVTVFEGKDAMLKIHADGTTEMGGHSGTMELKNGHASSDSLPVTYKPGPVLKTDGTATYEGKPVAKLNADGTVMDLTTNKIVPITVTADKLTISADGQTVEIAITADGTMTMPNGGKVAPHVEGADSAGKRRAVLLMVGMLIGGGEKKATVDSGSATAPATKL